MNHEKIDVQLTAIILSIQWVKILYLYHINKAVNTAKFNKNI